SLDYKQSPVAQVFRAGYQELLRLTRSRRGGEGESETELGGAANVERAMRRATNQEVTRLEKALTFLATTASTAPFIGLFGTVWGIMNAFRGLSEAQTSSIQAVAPGISEALVATAVGLAAAIPAVVGYNHFNHEVRVLHTDMENFSAEFLNIAERHFLKYDAEEVWDGFRGRRAIRATIDVSDQRHAARRRDARVAGHLHGHGAHHPAGSRRRSADGRGGAARGRVDSRRDLGHA